MATAILFPKDDKVKKQTGSQWFEKRFFESIGKTKTSCDQCGTSMWFPPSKAGKYKTCGSECAKESRRLAKLARTRICITCGNEFTPRTTQLSAGVGKYCSQACNQSHAVMNTPEVQARARMSWGETYKKAPFAKMGADNPRWNGGVDAKKHRDRMAGWPVQSARRAKTKHKFTAEFLLNLCKQQRWKCACCGTSIKTKKHLDHIVPLSRGGLHHELNVQFLCPKCNLTKQAKDPIDFMQSRGFLL